MTPLITRHKFDPSGSNPDNLVHNEPHPLRVLQARSLIPTSGAFYEKGLRVYDPSTQSYLIPKEQYKLHHLYTSVMKETGRAAYGVIVITDTDVNAAELLISYQAVGGMYANSLMPIERLLNTLKTDTRPSVFGNLANLPTEWVPFKHFHDIGDAYNFDPLTYSIERALAAMRLRDIISHDTIYKDVDLKIADLNSNGGQYARDSIAAHEAALDPHSQYVRKDGITQFLQPIRKPINIAPSAAATNVMLDVTVQTDAYHSIYRIPLASTQFQVSSKADFSSLEFDVTVPAPTLGYHYSGILAPNTVFYWRSRFTDTEGSVSEWSAATQFTSIAVSVAQPTITQPANTAESGIENCTIIATAFSISGATDTHASTDWEIWSGPNGTGNRIYASLTDATNKTQITIPLGTFVRNTTYYPRVRYRSSKYGASPWSVAASFYATWPLRPTVMGQAFGGGYWGGDFVNGGHTYAIIVAPKASGEKAAVLQSSSSPFGAAASTTDSVGNTNALLAANTAGSNMSAAAVFVKGLNIGGYTDWCIPAQAVMAILQTNLRPDKTTTPAIYKTGGVEAFLTSPTYWTSTTLDYSVDNSYFDKGPPIYGPTPWSGHYANWLNDSQGGPTDGNCPNIADPSTGAYFWASSISNIRDTGSTMYSHYTNGVPDPGAWLERFWTWDCVGYQMKVVGYQEGTYHQVINNYYQAYSGSFSSSASLTYEAKYNTRQVRAVRLVQVA